MAGRDGARAVRILLAGASLVLPAVLSVACGGSSVKDTQGGLVGRMSPWCNETLARIDRASLGAASDLGVPGSTAMTVARALLEETETQCLEEITDWSLAVRRLQKRLADAAVVAGDATPSVSCDAPAVWPAPQGMPGTETLAYVEEASTIIHLSPNTCLDLARLVGHPRRLSCVGSFQVGRQRCPASVTAEAVAVITLAHEQQHVDGESNEALVQCYAYQHAQSVARQLGVPRPAAARIAAYVTFTVPQPFSYSSTECRRNHSFDLHLPGPWPLSD